MSEEQTPHAKAFAANEGSGSQSAGVAFGAPVTDAATVNITALMSQYFYFMMSLLVAVVVVYGFSHTVGQNLFRPPSPRPTILYFHAALFASWIVFFITQSALIRTRNVQVHRRMGWFGLALGVAIPIVGTTTAIVMTRFRIEEGIQTDAAQFMIVPFFDMLAFSVAFGLAFYWRKKPESHRRLILIAACGLSAAAFSRFPSSVAPNWFYAGVDVLILLGVTRDLLMTKRIHPVYLYGLPLLMLGQTATMYTFLSDSPVWLRIAHAILG
jgi:hypothetical protein